MIVAVCLNPAIDVTYEVAHFTPGRSHRATSVHERAGGKGVNVARVLARLGAAVRLVGFAGGTAGELLRHDLAAAGVATDLVAVDGATRRCVTVVDGSAATVVNEPGPDLVAADWQALLASTADWHDARVVVLSGSVPPGAPVDAYAQLIAAAHHHGARTVLDADGEWLRAGVAAGPDVVKPNAVEAAALLGRDVASTTAAVEAAHALVAAGAGAALVSRGADGLVWADGARALEVTTPPVTGNPTGAGDALAAALALGLATGADLHTMLHEAAATAAAAVAHPVAGDFDADVRRAVAAAVTVNEVTACRS
ncbi:1-phosphofructokinase family hexose kinase [Jatrophihabitans fulvus]